ncbi:ABC transporter ATP-binding protein [Mycoplasma zalophi]|uniref:ABC transporter ATP-binding protein n=1 Tax=Mycoplasma zalophi TaxID=191287 RepID=A0ABS6DQE0_9MOLU|nr:ABC transporter ATP-binding protein [Mycoplasma zalophi]MBU4691254.1 ABC transporter ATP-binding protein [Mycoplasma zalophi]MBU4692540.1 ABC transporter ATP-binding protein [Mycoplasma zalophi]
MDKTKNIYKEQKSFGKTLYREIREGTEEMLNSVDKPTIVEIRNMDVTYGSGAKAFKALKDFNLNIYKGEVLGLVGESGSGKTTAGRAIIGLTPHSFGEIKILGKPIPKNLNKVFKWSKKGKEIIDFMVNKVQMIFQDPTNSLNPFKNVEYIISEGLTNTKNSKSIYLYNFDQQSKKQIYALLSKEKNPEFFGKFEQDLEKSLSQEPDLVFKTFYEEFYNKVIALKNDQLTQLFNELKQQRIDSNNISEKQAKQHLVLDILKSVGLDDSVLNRYPLEFSGGQQQRIGICRAIILQPQLLIADEPISALDVSIQAQVINIFKELKEKYNLTILFIAHDLRMVEYISDRIAVMNKGTLLEVGSTTEIIKNPHHPYTQSLLDAVPSIEAERGSLVGKAYDPSIHEYDEQNQPKWQKISNNHFVLASDKEFPVFKESAKNYKSKIIK